MCMFVWGLKPSTCGSLENNETCNAISLLEKKQTTVISLFNGHFWAIATAEACKGEAKLSSTLWIVAMSMICFCYVLLVSNMFDRKSTWNDDCYIISPRVTCFFQKLVAQPPEISQLREIFAVGAWRKAQHFLEPSRRESSIGGGALGVPGCSAVHAVRRHGMVGHFSIEFP